MARKKEQPPEGPPEWMTTYSDMVTLLLTFFILLFSMATIDKNRFSEIAQSLQNSVLKLNSGDSILKNSGSSIITVDLSKNQTAEQRAQEKEKVVEAAEDMVVDARQQIENKKFDEARDEIRATIKEKGLSDKVQVTEEKDYLLVTLESEVFFDSGSADIRPDSMKLLSSLAEILKSIDKEILISGHTDNVPINSTEFKSNWELSTARATNVVGYFIETAKMDPTTFTATGNGEYRPIADNATAEGRQKNRRIEIKILK